MSDNKKRYKLEVTRTYEFEIEIDYDVFSKKHVDDYEPWIGKLPSPRELLEVIDHYHYKFGYRSLIEGIGKIPVLKPSTIEEGWKRIEGKPYDSYFPDAEDGERHGIWCFNSSELAEEDVEIQAISGEGFETEIDEWPWDK